MAITKTALMLNSDGSIYHLHLFPDELATTIILVGDPDRVPLVSRHFDRIEIQKQNREFVAHTGYVGKHRLSVISTGIGVGNIDIVMNEVDALFNVDFQNRTVKNTLTPLAFVRIGTSGTLQPHIATDSFVVSKYALAFDGLMHFYRHLPDAEEKNLTEAVRAHFHRLPVVSNVYAAKGSTELCRRFETHCQSGITLTMGGFYGPQYRQLRAPIISESIIDLASNFHFHENPITNFEMETAAIYGLGRLLGHQCCSLNAIVANRITHTVSKDAHTLIKRLIQITLENVI